VTRLVTSRARGNEETRNMNRLAHLVGAIPIVAGSILMTASPIQAGDHAGNPVVKTQGNGALCGKRDEIVRSLGDQFHEKQQAVGVVDQNAILEIFVSAAGTWTIIATGTDGNSCLVSSGEGWDSMTMMAGVDV
jgi:hypothetical protein